MSERRSRLVRAILIFSALPSIALLVGLLAFIAWRIFALLDEDFSAGVVVVLPSLAVVGVSAYVGLRIGRKLQRRSTAFLRGYRAKREREGQSPEDDDPGP